MVDQNGVVQTFPGLSMLTGLFGNALGWDHRESEKLTSLQDRLRYAARIDRRGTPLVDYQTVALGSDWMNPEKAGWTTRGRIAKRGGASGDSTHQRYRHYRADSIHTVSTALDGEGEVTIHDLAQALREPRRPLFIGRKCCLPATPILLGEADSPSLLEALASIPRSSRADDGPLRATWSEGDGGDGISEGESYVVAVTDERDWKNQIHTGRRLMREGRVNPPGSGA